jgi:O-antigen/teichoic acid export membrane protein
VRTMYMLSFALVVTTFVIPTYFILQSDKGLKAAQDFIERITLLSMFYIFLSFVGLIIVIIRNF